MVKTDLLRRGVPWVSLLMREGRSSKAMNLSDRNRASTAASVLFALAVLARRVRLARAALLAILALNHSFYALLWRPLGPVRAVPGVGLHILHQLTAATALPVGVALHLLRRRRDGG
jgi:hypothetical protein